MHTTAYRPTKKLRDSIMQRDNYTCQCCGKPATDADHIKAYSKGGETVESNLRATCHWCNMLNIEREPVPTDTEWLAQIQAELALWDCMRCCV